MSRTKTRLPWTRPERAKIDAATLAALEADAWVSYLVGIREDAHDAGPGEELDLRDWDTDPDGDFLGGGGR